MLTEVIKHLRQLGNDEIKPENDSVGVCREIYDKFGVVIPSSAYIGWSLYSDDEVFPVPATKEHKERDYMSPHEVEYLTVDNLWGYNESGDSRRNLCLYVADYCEQLMKSHDRIRD